MYTRKDYMDGKVTHDAYYSQFVTPEVRAIVARCIGAGRIRASTDPHFNDIPLREWDAIIGFTDGPQPRVATSLGVRTALEAAGDSVSASTLTCVMKAAARQIKEGVQ